MNFKVRKRRIIAAFSCLNWPAVGIFAGLSLLLGVIIAVSGGGRYPHVCYYLPRGALPTFFVMLFWGLAFALLGATLGIFLFSRRCRCERSRMHSLLLFIFALTASYAWIPIVYKAGSLFFGLILSLLLIAVLVLLFFALCKSEPIAAFGTLICAFWAFYVAYYTFSLFLLNG